MNIFVKTILLKKDIETNYGSAAWWEKTDPVGYVRGYANLRYSEKALLALDTVLRRAVAETNEIQIGVDGSYYDWDSITNKPPENTHSLGYPTGVGTFGIYIGSLTLWESTSFTDNDIAGVCEGIVNHSTYPEMVAVAEAM